MHEPINSAARAHVAEPGYQCRFETRGDFGAISASFDVPRSGAPPRGSVRWEALADQSRPLLFSAEWRRTDSGHLRLADGEARITAPLPPEAEQSHYVGLHVRADPDSVFTNPFMPNSSMLDGGGGLVHIFGDNLYFFNASWRNVIVFAKSYPRSYLFGILDQTLKRQTILARFEIDSTPFLRADDQIRSALDRAGHMLANPAASCFAVDDLPPPRLIIYD